MSVKLSNLQQFVHGRQQVELRALSTRTGPPSKSLTITPRIVDVGKTPVQIPSLQRTMLRNEEISSVTRKGAA
jgi:hypothetical protein